MTFQDTPDQAHARKAMSYTNDRRTCGSCHWRRTAEVKAAKRRKVMADICLLAEFRVSPIASCMHWTSTYQ